MLFAQSSQHGVVFAGIPVCCSTLPALYKQEAFLHTHWARFTLSTTTLASASLLFVHKYELRHLICLVISINIALSGSILNNLSRYSNLSNIDIFWCLFLVNLFSFSQVDPIPIILYPYQDDTRDIRSYKTLCLKEFPRAKPEGTPEGKGLYLTVYPELSPNTNIISF